MDAQTTRGTVATGVSPAGVSVTAPAPARPSTPVAAGSTPAPRTERPENKNGHDTHSELLPGAEREALAREIVEASARHAADPRQPIEAEEDEVDELPEPRPAPRAGCLWIEDEPGDPAYPTWCGAARSPGRPYCVRHCVRAYVPSGGGRFEAERFQSPPPQERAAA